MPPMGGSRIHSETLEPCWRDLEPEESPEVGFELDGASTGADHNPISLLHVIRILLQEGLEAGMVAAVSLSLDSLDTSHLSQSQVACP